VVAVQPWTPPTVKISAQREYFVGDSPDQHGITALLIAQSYSALTQGRFCIRRFLGFDKFFRLKGTCFGGV
jgi:hypothetical protein